MNTFKEKYSDLEIYWETLAAIGAATGSVQLVDYAHEHKGGQMNMCTALDNLMKKGIQEGIQESIRKMVKVLRQLNIDNESILQKLQEEFELTYEEAQEYLT